MNETKSYEDNDAAARLHRLCSLLLGASSEVIVGKHYAKQVALWQAFGPLAHHLGVENYAVLRDSFLLLVEEVRTGVHRLELRKATVRESWLGSVTTVSSVFDADNFGTATETVFARVFSKENMQTLDAISERFQAQGWEEQPKPSIEEALLAIIAVVEEMEKSGTFPLEMLRVLRHLIAQMRTAIDTYETFGAEAFWRTYKETFATFVQLHNWISEAPNKEALQDKVAVVGRHLVGALSIAANAASVVGFGLPLFLPGNKA